MTVLPPGRLSTTTDWPNVLLILSPIRRASGSTLPPGGNGTTSLIGLLGKVAAVCADADNGTTAAHAARNTAANGRDFMFVSWMIG